MGAGTDIIGKAVQDSSDLQKAKGRLVFSDDLYFDEMCHGALLFGGVPHALLKRVNHSRAGLMPGVIRVLTAADVPGINRFGIIQADQPVFAEDKIRFVGDPIALVIAETEEIAREAVRSITVDLSELPVIASPEEAMRRTDLPPSMIRETS